jgi:hypothetical protein
MPQTLETFQLNMLQPMQNPEDARPDAMKFAASLTISKGQAVSVTTATGLGSPLVPGASDGTQLFVGFSAYDFITDSNGKVFFSDSTAAAWRNTPWSTAPIWKRGTFDPADLKTKATPVAEVDTFTPGGTITTGDVNKLTYTAPDGTVTVISFTVAGTTTAAAVSAGLIAAWNANATATGSTTVILTGVTAGTPFTVASSVTGVGTLTRAATTAASGRALSDILVGRPGAYVQQNGFWNV